MTRLKRYLSNDIISRKASAIQMGWHVPRPGVVPLQGTSGEFDSPPVHKTYFDHMEAIPDNMSNVYVNITALATNVTRADMFL